MDGSTGTWCSMMASAASPRRWAQTSDRLSAPIATRCGAKAASSRQPDGTTMRLPLAPPPPRNARIMASVPRIGLSSPVSESSPTNSRSARASPGIWPLAARMPTAIGRSKRPESLGRSAGARLTVSRRLGNSNPQFSSAARTRSALSRTAACGRPTMWNAGNPLPTWTSTRTSGACRPTRARERTTARDIWDAHGRGRRMSSLGAARRCETPWNLNVRVGRTG